MKSRTMMQPLFRLVLCALLLPSASWAAGDEVYRWRDADGVVHYSDRRPSDGVRDAEVVKVKRQAEASVSVSLKTDSTSLKVEIPPAQLSAPRSVSVVMYSSPTCGWCRRAERYFDRRGVPWRSIDITASERAAREFAELGGRGTPLIFVEGERVAGFNKDRLDQLLTKFGR